MKAKKSRYWDIEPILKIPAQYRIVFGERSHGKSYSTLHRCLKRYIKSGEQSAYVRRWPDDIKMRMMQQLFEPLLNNNVVTELSGGMWNGIKYRNGAFYLIATDGEKTVVEDERPFMYVFAISAMEHTKSTSYPGVTIIIFDEFISRVAYITDEFSMFMNILSTIIRDRDNVEIWMLGNTVSKDCLYFREMGLRHVKDQKPGTIDTYSYQKNGQELLIAVEFTENLVAKKSDKYFIFDNPKLEMITNGAWELAVYPHLFEKYRPKQILYTFFIVYREETLQCEVVEGTKMPFIYIHAKTTPLKELEEDLIYSVEPSANPMHRVDITRPEMNIEKTIVKLVTAERVCFQDNEIGEIFNDYLKWCRSHQIIRK